MLLAATPSIQAQKGEDRSGTYYIANYNNNGYDSSDPSNNYYLCPSTDMYDANGEMPFLTTFQERTASTPRRTQDGKSCMRRQQATSITTI